MEKEFREEFESYLERIRSSDKTLTELQLSGRSLNDSDIIELVEAIPQNSP